MGLRLFQFWRNSFGTELYFGEEGVIKTHSTILKFFFNWLYGYIKKTPAVLNLGWKIFWCWVYQNVRDK